MTQLPIFESNINTLFETYTLSNAKYPCLTHSTSSVSTGEYISSSSDLETSLSLASPDLCWNTQTFSVLDDACQIVMSLQDLIAKFGSLPLLIARTLFKRIVEAVINLHNIGLYHGELQLENVYFDSEFNVKLSSHFSVDDESIMGATLDTVCLGELLFSMISGSLLYESDQDPSFLAIVEGNWPEFWNISEQIVPKLANGGPFFKSDLRDLLQNLLSPSTEGEDFTATKAQTHMWMKGAIISGEHVLNLLVEVHKKMQSI